MVLAVLVVGVLVVPFLVAPSAHGDPIGDVRARADEVSAQISELEARIVADTHAMEQARYEATQIEVRIEAAEGKLVEARRSEEASREQLSRFALQAYVSGGSDQGFVAVLGTDGDKVESRNGYVAAAVGDRQQLVDALQATQLVTAEHKEQLESARAEAEAVAEEIAERKASSQRAADELARVKSQLDGELAELVAAKQAAEARAAEARARAAAQRQAEAEAAQARARQQAQAQAAAQVTTAPESIAPQSTIPEASIPPADNTVPDVPVPSSGVGGTVVAAAQTQLGVPYLWGGTSPGVGLDCSGLTQFAYRQAGISIPRVTYAQMGAGRSIPLSQIQAGDLVFYSDGSHVGIYVGGGQIIHAPHTGAVVRYASLYMSSPQLVVRPG